MENPVGNLNEQVEKLKDVTVNTDLALTEMRLQFETMMEMQKEERIESQKMHNEEKANIRKHYGRIIIGLIITICLIIGGIVGGLIWFFSNYELKLGTEFSQYLDVGGNGSPTIYDGIHYDRTD